MRDLRRELLKELRGREDSAHFGDSDVVNTARHLWDGGVTSPIELKKTRLLNRNFMIEDLRKEGRSARDLALFTALLHLFPAPSQRQEA